MPSLDDHSKLIQRTHHLSRHKRVGDSFVNILVTAVKTKISANCMPTVVDEQLALESAGQQPTDPGLGYVPAKAGRRQKYDQQ